MRFPRVTNCDGPGATKKGLRLARETWIFTPSRRRGVFGVDESKKLEASPISVRLGNYFFESHL